MNTDQINHAAKDPFLARVAHGLRELDGLETAPDVRAQVADRLRRSASLRVAPPRRRRPIAMLAALLALAVTATLMWQMRTNGTGRQTQDPQAQQLVYRTATTPEPQQRDAMLQALRARIGGLGTVTSADREVTITVADGRMSRRVRTLVEGDKLLELRMVADADYVIDEVGGHSHFVLAEEQRLLQAWLDAGGADELRKDLHAIDSFRAASPWLRWHPHVVRPQDDLRERWEFSFTSIPTSLACTVATFGDDDWNDGVVPAHLREMPAEQCFLIELVAVNLHEVHFGGGDIDPESIRLHRDEHGRDSLDYAMRGPAAKAYADFSERQIGHHQAILWDGELLSAPRFESRIPGRGALVGAPALLHDLERIFRNPVALPLEFVR